MAIEASAALPGLFPPVRIGCEYYVDGALNKTLHASVALDEGMDLVLCVNPLVPFDASGAGRNGHLTVKKLSQGGLPLVLSQTFRAVIHSRMKGGMERYRRQYPHADILLFEPDREDAEMFFAAIFGRAAKRLSRGGIRQDTACCTGRDLVPAREAWHSASPQSPLDPTRVLLDALMMCAPLHATDGSAAGFGNHARPRPTLDHLERWLETAR
jgi:hypothetical protein